MIANWLARLNEFRIWRRPVPFHGFRFSPPTLDRWVALQAHRFGLMGKGDFLFLDSLIEQDWHIADVGANQGLYTLYFSRQSPKGRVYAFEPDPSLFASLEENIKQNGAENVLLFNAAAADRTAKLTLRAGRFNRGDNRIVPAHLASVETTDVDAMPLDDAISEGRLDLLKIDVQGFEVQVLRGAERLILANPDLAIFSEFWPHGLRMAGAGPEEFLEILAKAGFSIYRQTSIETTEPFVYRANEWRRASQFCNLVATRQTNFWQKFAAKRIA
jgi:FkbM family methyltransferase